MIVPKNGIVYAMRLVEQEGEEKRAYRLPDPWYGRKRDSVRLTTTLSGANNAKNHLAYLKCGWRMEITPMKLVPVDGEPGDNSST